VKRDRPPAFRLDLNAPPFGDGSTRVMVMIHAKKALAWTKGWPLEDVGAAFNQIRDYLLRGEFDAIHQYPFIVGWCVGVPASDGEAP